MLENLVTGSLGKLNFGEIFQTVFKMLTYIAECFGNSLSPSSGLPLYRNESLCKTFHMKMSLICMKIDMQGKHIFTEAKQN